MDEFSAALPMTLEPIGSAAEPGLTDLLRWKMAEPIPNSDIETLERHPRLGEAARRLANNYLTASARDKALDGIGKDGGRYVSAMWAMQLHVSGGLTLPRLKEVCASSGLLSPGRARALLLYMRYLGFVALLPVKPRGEPARYVPTARFQNTWRTHMRDVLEVVQVIEPAVALLLARFDQPGVMEKFTWQHAQALLGMTRHYGVEIPFLKVFVHHNAGTQIVSALLLASAERRFPPEGPIPFSMSETARRFGVSRIHVRRLIDLAIAQGQLSASPGGALQMEAPMRTYLTWHYAMQFLALLSAAAWTVASLPEIFAA